MRRIAPALRREELINAAVTVIARDGIVAATTRAIASEAKMPLGAFHYVFDSRDELIAAVIDELMGRELGRALEGITLGGPRTVTQVLEAGLNGFIDWLTENPDLELALFELAFFAARTGTSGGMGAQYSAYYRASAALVAQAAVLGGVQWNEPVDRLARHLTALVDGLTTTWLADRDTAAAREFAFFAASALATKAHPISHPQTTVTQEYSHHAH